MDADDLCNATGTDITFRSVQKTPASIYIINLIFKGSYLGRRGAITKRRRRRTILGSVRYVIYHETGGTSCSRRVSRLIFIPLPLSVLPGYVQIRETGMSPRNSKARDQGQRHQDILNPFVVYLGRRGTEAPYDGWRFFLQLRLGRAS